MIDCGFVKLFKELCNVPSISGMEQQMARSVRSELTIRGAKVESDRMGNVYTCIKGKGNALSLMFIAHMDEVGGIITGICDNGLLMFHTAGFVDESSLPAIRVRVDGNPGTISAPPAHTSADAGTERQPLCIDVGAESSADVREMGIEIGSMVTYDTPFTLLGKHRVCGHALDDRVGCAMLITLFEHIDFEPEGDVWLGFSVREETTMTGAGMLVDRIKPDWAVAVDTVPIRLAVGDSGIDLGKGPVLQMAEGVMKAYVGNVVHPGIRSALKGAATAANVSCQFCAEVGSWTTDGDIIHRSNLGTPCGYISVPRRSAHSASEVMDLRDALNGVKLMESLIKRMDKVILDFI